MERFITFTEQFYQLLIHGKVQREDGPCIDVTDFTFTESEGAKVPFAYAADCMLKPAVTICSLYGTNLKFEKSAKTFIGYFGHRVRNRFLNAKRGLLEISDLQGHPGLFLVQSTFYQW